MTIVEIFLNNDFPTWGARLLGLPKIMTRKKKNYEGVYLEVPELNSKEQHFLSEFRLVGWLSSSQVLSDLMLSCQYSVSESEYYY